MQGERPYLEKAKRPPGRPATGHPHALPVPAKTAPGRRRATASTRHRPPERVDAARVGRIAAGHPAPAEAAGAHLAAVTVQRDGIDYLNETIVP